VHFGSILSTCIGSCLRQCLISIISKITSMGKPSDGRRNEKSFKRLPKFIMYLVMKQCTNLAMHGFSCSLCATGVMQATGKASAAAGQVWRSMQLRQHHHLARLTCDTLLTCVLTCVRRWFISSCSISSTANSAAKKDACQLWDAEIMMTWSRYVRGL